MYERFTDRARKVMQLANQEAQRFNHEYVGTEHILLGLVKEGSGVAANVLKNLDIDLRKIRLEVEKIVQYGPAQPPQPSTIRKVLGFAWGKYPDRSPPETPRAKKVIEYAIAESRILNHNYVGTEHLLLGSLREQEGVAAQILMNLGLKLEDVREEVLNLLGHEMPMVRGEAPAGAPQPDAVPCPPVPLTEEELRVIRDRVRRLDELKQQFVAEQDFVQAVRCRDEAEALKQLLAWYEWSANTPE